MLQPAVLGALADERPHPPRLDPDAIRLVRDRVHLSRQLWNPEAVGHVDRPYRDERQRRARLVTHRDVDLVRGDDPELRIANLPPPLVTDNGDLERVRRLRASLDPPDVPRGDQEQDDDDQERHDRPRQLDLGAAIHLRRLDLRVRRAPAETDERVDGEARDDHEDRGRDRENDERQIADRERRGGNRRKDVRRLDWRHRLTLGTPSSMDSQANRVPDSGPDEMRQKGSSRYGDGAGLRGAVKCAAKTAVLMG